MTIHARRARRRVHRRYRSGNAVARFDTRIDSLLVLDLAEKATP